MEGWWDTQALDQTLFRFARANIQDAFPRDLPLLFSIVRGRLLNMQRLKIREVPEKHYDMGNDLYEAMLDKRMIYSCGYWKDATTLDEAQEAKLDLICRKIGLQPGMRVLDIGSGWGGFLQFAAERYGIEGLGVTVSTEQAALANERTRGLPVKTRLMDYQALEGTFDRVVSIGMFEHVGYKNYCAYFETARRLLVDDGLMLLHTIGGNISTTHGDPWAEKYIFPNGMLPSVSQIGTATEGLFVMEDWHNFGADYDRTLMAWLHNFDTAWPRFSARYDERSAACGAIISAFSPGCSAPAMSSCGRWCCRPRAWWAAIAACAEASRRSMETCCPRTCPPLVHRRQLMPKLTR